MRPLSLTVLVGFVLALGACKTFPTLQLTADFTNEPTPVMLSPVKSSTKTRTLDFESGFTQNTMSVSASSGGITNTSTMTDSRNNNQPLASQVQNTLLQEPAWLSVEQLEFNDNYFVMIAYGSIEKVNLTTRLKLRVPVGGQK